MTEIEKTLTDIVNNITDEAYQTYSDEDRDEGKHITDLIRRIGKSSLRVGDERIYLVCGWDLPDITGALEHKYFEHANQQPLRLEDLEDMHDLPVYLSDRDVWAIVDAEDDDVWLVINGETPGHPEVLLAGWQIDRGEKIYANKPLGMGRTCRECYDGPRKALRDNPEPETMPDNQLGLYSKYLVYKDGKPLDGDCFVLRPDRDPAAAAALRAYAGATQNKALAADIIRWVGDAEPLTLEKLEQLRGTYNEPVFVVQPDGKSYWTLFNGHEKMLFIWRDRVYSGWKLYAHKPGGEV